METPVQSTPFEQVNPPSAGTLAVKRVFDVVCAALGLLVFSPLLLAVAAVVACSSPGGVFFRQARMGRGAVPFTMYKFRTMYPGRAGLPLTVGNDARVTPAGQVLRRCKLDELPQLWNVLKGDMSFVGPRPEVEKYVRFYTAEQRQIFLVRPGITDPATIAYRSESDLLAASADPEALYLEEILPQKLALGLAYIRGMSFFGDLGLIFKTLAAIFRG